MNQLEFYSKTLDYIIRMRAAFLSKGILVN